MAVIERLQEMHEEFTQIRRDIHAHPELGFEEDRTSDIVAAKLTEWGIDIHRGLGKTGVVGTIRVGNDPRSIGLRADMDALPILEANSFDHKSVNDGKMHACGHDGHTTMLLCAAKYLAETKNFEGAVHFIFQPAEEGIGGAKAMVEEGLFDLFPCDSIFGMHNRPSLEVGKFAMRPGPMMAGGALFDLHIEGKGAHGARPESGVDPVIIAAQIATAVQTIVSRNVPPQKPAVLSITEIHGGDAYNVIPQSAVMRGTARAFDTDVLKLIEKNFRSIAEGIASGMGAKADLDFRLTFLPTVNDPDETQFAGDIAAEIVGEENVNRNGPLINASEDFSFMLDVRPGAYINIGNGMGNGEGACEVHNPGYDFNDEAIPQGASFFVRAVEKKLAPRA